jgi:hypothetical protein
MDDWVAKQCTLINVAKEKQLQTDFHAMNEYDPSITEYPVHSYVLFTPPFRRSNKLLPRHRDSFQVIEKTTSICTIEDLVSGKRITTHIHNLRPFNYDPDRTSPLEVAQQNEQEFVVEAIIATEDQLWSSRSAGQDSTPHALLHVDKLHDYLRNNAMKEQYGESFSRFSYDVRQRFFPRLVFGG